MTATLTLLAQRSSSGSAAAGVGLVLMFFGVMTVFSLVIYVFMSFCLARVFRKAGVTEWWAWVPFVSSYGMWKMTNRDQLWLILLFVPYANYVALVVIGIDIAWSFGKSQAYGWGVGLLPYVFFPMLAFDESTYRGPAPTDSLQWSTPSAGAAGYGGYGYGYGQPGVWGQTPPPPGYWYDPRVPAGYPPPPGYAPPPPAPPPPVGPPQAGPAPAAPNEPRVTSTDPQAPPPS